MCHYITLRLAVQWTSCQLDSFLNCSLGAAPFSQYPVRLAKRDFENNIQILRFRSSMEYVGIYLPFSHQIMSFSKNILMALFIMESIYGRSRRWWTTVFVYHY